MKPHAADELARRAEEHASRPWLSASAEYHDQLIETFTGDLVLAVAKGEAADRVGAVAIAELPARSRRRAGEIDEASLRFHRARDRARRAVEALFSPANAKRPASRGRTVRRWAMALLVAIILLMLGAMPVLERLGSIR